MADGNIVAAKTRFGRAVDELVEPRAAVYHTGTHWAPSLYDCLLSDSAGSQGDHKSVARSLPPIWVDAVQLRTLIDSTVRSWQGKPASTPDRLRVLKCVSWRPQDTDRVWDMTRKVAGWCESIKALLDPLSVKTVDAECPQCGKSWVYGRDSAGEMVRRPALQLVLSSGCTCQHCGAHWGPERYLFLVKLLGFELPEGVLE